MTIDDIHYLYKHSTKENIVLLIDSSKRDKKVYRTPSEFVIEFPEPFKNVIGVEVLNAAIPRTTFTVDDHNNKLNLWSYEYRTDDNNNQVISNEFRDKILLPNDFNAAEKLLSSLTTLFRETDETFNVEADSLALEADADIATKGFLKLESTLSPFIMDNRIFKSPLKPILGFNLHASESDGTYETLNYLKRAKQYLYPLSSGETIIDRKKLASHVYNVEIDSSDLFTSDGQEEGGDGIAELELQLPFIHFNCGLLIETIKVNQQEYDLTKLDSLFCFDGKIKIVVTDLQERKHSVEVKYTFLMPNGKYLLSLDADHTYASRISNYNFDDKNPVHVTEDFSGEDEDTVVKFVTDTSRVSVFLNQFKIKIKEIPNASFGKNMLYFKSSHSTIIQEFLLEVNYSIDENQDYFIEFDASKYLMRNLNPMNFMRVLNVSYQVYHMKNDNIADAQRIDLIEAFTNDDTISDSTVNSTLYDVQFKIVPPGIINMVTENYVILRCPEIENHSRGSYDANDVSPGLALFTIDVKSGYAGNKNEFFSVKYKEFHPIGKLSRLHFRFERKSDRKLYDFKGIDLHFMLSLKMLAAQKLNERELEYSLNPNYDPDYQGFMKSSFEYVESDEELEGQKIKQSDFEEEVKLQNIAYQRKLQLEESSDESGSDAFTTDDDE